MWWTEPLRGQVTFPEALLWEEERGMLKPAFLLQSRLGEPGRTQGSDSSAHS